jgi:AcrR family transcriptional regulator
MGSSQVASVQAPELAEDLVADENVETQLTSGPLAAADAAPCAQVRSDPILAAAYDVLLDVGPARATLTEVARRAGVSRMTVYRRSAHLRTLVSEVLTHELVTLLDIAQRGAEGNTDATRIAATVSSAAQAIAGHPLMLRLIALDPAALLPQLVTRRGSTQRAAEAMLATMLRSSSDGSIRSRDPELTSRIVVTAASAFIYTESLARSEGDRGERWDEFAAMIGGYLS